MTDASAETYAKLSKSKQKEFLEAHFGKKKGISYSTVTHTNINSCDFSSDMYTYVQEKNTELKAFDVDYDKNAKFL